MTLTPKTSGQPFDRSVRTYNEFVAAARHARGGERPPQNIIPPLNSASILYCENNTGGDRKAFEVAAVGGVSVTPSEQLDNFKHGPIPSGVAPASLADRDTFLVWQEPVPAGYVGRAVLAGVTVAQVDVVDEAHGRCGTIFGDCTKLRTTDNCNYPGAGRILYKESGTGLKWALIRIDDCDCGCDPCPGSGSLCMTIGGCDLTQLAGYNPAVVQLLGHNTAGCLVWIDAA